MYFIPIDKCSHFFGKNSQKNSCLHETPPLNNLKMNLYLQYMKKKYPKFTAKITL